MKLYKQLMKVINSSSALVKDDDLMDFYRNGYFQPPKHKYNGRKPCIGCVFDDCKGSMIYSRPRKLNALSTYSRHVGAFEDGRPAIGINLFFLIQTLKAQVGGHTKVIRNQATLCYVQNLKNQPPSYLHCTGSSLCFRPLFFTSLLTLPPRARRADHAVVLRIHDASGLTDAAGAVRGRG